MLFLFFFHFPCFLITVFISFLLSVFCLISFHLCFISVISWLLFLLLVLLFVCVCFPFVLLVFSFVLFSLLISLSFSFNLFPFLSSYFFSFSVVVLLTFFLFLFNICFLLLSLFLSLFVFPLSLFFPCFHLFKGHFFTHRLLFHHCPFNSRTVCMWRMDYISAFLTRDWQNKGLKDMDEFTLHLDFCFPKILSTAAILWVLSCDIRLWVYNRSTCTSSLKH